MSEYRIVEGIGLFWNKQYKLQKKYSYYENGEKIYSWHTIFTSPDIKRCEEALAKRIGQVEWLIGVRFPYHPFAQQ